MTTPNSLAVTYTGKEAPFIERNYGSSLSFEPGQTRALPAELAAKLLRHADVFELAAPSKPKKAQTEETAAQTDEATKPKDEVDDTATQLAEATKKQDEQGALVNERQNVVDQVNLMDKDALKEYAHIKYGQPLPKTLSVDNMRAKVVGFIDQYGLV